MIIKEDQTAPVGLEVVSNAVTSGSRSAKQEIVQILLDLLNEKRDAYNGIASSIIYMISSENQELIELLQQSLLGILTRHPMKYGAKMFISKVLFRLTQERPNFVAKLFEQLIRTTTIWEKSINDTDQVLRLQIIALKAIRQAEHVEMKTLSTLTRDEINHLCAKAMSSCDDSTKIDTLSLILQSRSTTKILDQQELDVFRLAFQDALGLQEPSLRQTFLAITNKLLERLKGGLRLAMRDKIKFTDEERISIKARYNTFLEWLIDFCLDSIYCNAYFGSFILTMSTLKLVIQHVTFTDKHLPIERLFCTRRCYDSILSCLNDSFEENKSLALELLFLIPENEKFLAEFNMEQFEKIAYYLVNSVNPAHSLTCQYVFKLLVGLGCKNRNKNKSESDNEISKTKNQLLHHHLSKLLTLVEDGVEETRTNLIVALKNNAIYPKLTCIRALLNEIEVNDLERHREQWAPLAARIVEASIEACHAVSSVVCNLNPETIGHLPMDLKPVNVEALSKSLNVSLNITQGQLATISSQMLLISGWKTIKECSLSMGTMCTCFWWPKERLRGKREKYPGLKIAPILATNDIKKIIAFFDHYLRNLRHRGAFEQAYYGFHMVTKRIWHDEQFRAQLTGTLTEIMNDFRARQQHQQQQHQQQQQSNNQQQDDKRVEFLKAYVTRRSAGLPFIVQAILNSEDKQDSRTLRWVMDCLFDILNSGESEIYQRIHCLNILRALIKESCLGEKVIPYIGQTLAITMDSFRSDSFPIRNCANMLLKATVDRTFGVNRLRDDIHRRNKLSFEKFFQECPNIHEKMLKHLNDGLCDRKCLASVHSVMIILFRLKPKLIDQKSSSSSSSSSSSDTEKIVRPFIEPIRQLAYTCADFKLRQVAAKLAVQLEVYCYSHTGALDDQRMAPFVASLKDIQRTVLSLSSGGAGDLNKCHGALSLLKYWILRMRFTEEYRRQSEYLREFTQELVQNLMQLLEEKKKDDDNLTNTMRLFLLDVVESYCLVWPDEDIRIILKQLYCLIETFAPSPCATMRANANQQQSTFNPHLEAVLFKSISILLMSTCNGIEALKSSLNISHEPLEDVIDWLVKIVTLPANRVISVDLQASIVRLLRQLIADDGQEENYLSKLMEHLDLDSTATYETPFDKLCQQSDNDFEQERWARYCERPTRVKVILRNRFNGQRSSECCLFNLGRYEEFKQQIGFGGSSLKAKFSAKFSNTPRSIELLALACKVADNHLVFNYSSGFTTIDTVTSKLAYFNEFLSSLPDCDVKCLSLLYSSDLFSQEIGRMDSSQLIEWPIFVRYTEVLEELADGHHSYIIRETCSEVLSKCLQVAIGQQMSGKNLLQGGLMMNLLSTLIKLCQDEEHSIRQCSFRIMNKLRDGRATSLSSSSSSSSSSSASRMNNLISLLTTRLLDPNSREHVKYCFELSMRIIFNHTKNFCTTSNEEREILFDKSKLNTFADHVATIQSALQGLKLFFNRQSTADGQPRQSVRVDINSLEFSQDVLRELQTTNSTQDESGPNADANLGDYNWRLKKSFKDNLLHDTGEHPQTSNKNNNLILNGVLQNILESLDYFSNGYWNMLTDTDYPYHELSIFKRVAFVKFILECTEFELEDLHLIDKIRSKLTGIVDQSSSTTMLSKCLELLDN